MQKSFDKFITPAWKQHAELITHLSHASQNILMAIAPLGGGKTTFFHYLQSLYTPNLQKIAITARREDPSVEGIIADVVEAFGLYWEGIDHAFEQIHLCMEEGFNTHQLTYVLLVDDAHLLSDEQIQVLLELTHADSQLAQQLHLVLLGEHSLELRLFSPEFSTFRKGKMYTIELESWTLNDVRAYFNQIKEGLPRLHADQIAAIFERSRGLPGAVMREKEAFLAQPHTKSKKLKTESIKMPKFKLHPITLGILAGTFLGGSYLLFSHNTEEALEASVPLNAAQYAENEWDEEWKNDKALFPKAEPVKFHFDEDESAAVNIPSDQTIASLPASTTTSTNQKESASEAVKVAAAGIEVMMPDTTKTQETQTTYNKPPAVKPPPAPVREKLTPIATMSKPSAPDRMAKKVKKVVAKQENKKALQAKEVRLLSANQKHYTLQLLGASKEENVQRFIQHHAMGNKAHYIRTKVSGKDWFVVVYGDYPSKAAAQSAISTMPKSLKNENIKPWVRETNQIG